MPRGSGAKKLFGDAETEAGCGPGHDNPVHNSPRACMIFLSSALSAGERGPMGGLLGPTLIPRNSATPRNKRRANGAPRPWSAAPGIQSQSRAESLSRVRAPRPICSAPRSTRKACAPAAGKTSATRRSCRSNREPIRQRAENRCLRRPGSRARNATWFPECAKFPNATTSRFGERLPWPEARDPG